ncbi:MAG: S-methyl-5'-thioinosine phosphorylase [Lysobacterales bacterium]
MSRADIGIIGGTGFGRLADLQSVQSLDLDTAYGPPSSPVLVGSMAAVPVAFLARHGTPHRIAPHRVNYAANIAALKAVGVRRIIAINAVGGIAEWAGPGVLALPDQVVDYSHGRISSFSDVEGQAVEHIDFTDPFTQALRLKLLEAAQSTAIEMHDGGVLAVTQGPRLETRAEIVRLARDGCDLVGMTSMPEAALAREAGIDYAAIAVVANAAAGCGGSEVIGMHEIEQTLAQAMHRVLKLVHAVLPSL